MVIASKILNKKFAFMMILIILISSFVRFFAIDRYSIWVDESLQYFNSTVPLAFLQQTIAPQETFFSFIVDRCLNALHLDWSIAALRGRAAIAGVATTPLIYAIFSNLINRRVGIIAALAGALCPILVQYGQEFRMYSYVVLFDTTAAWSVLSYCRSRNLSYLVVYVVFMILSLYSHFLSVLVYIDITVFLVGFGVVQLWQRRGFGPDVFKFSFAVSSATIVIGVADLSAIPAWARFFFWEKLGGEAGGHLAINYDSMSTVLGQYQGVGSGVGFVFTTVLALLGWAVAVRQHPQAAWFGATWILLPILAFSITGGARILSTNRYVVFLFPVYVGFLANGALWLGEMIDAAAKRWRPRTSQGPYAAFALASALVMLVYLPGLHGLYAENPKPLTYDLANAYRSLNGSLRPGDLVIELAGDNDASSGGRMPRTDPAWFRFYDSFLEKDRPASARDHILIAEPSVTGEAMRSAMAEQTRLIVLAAVTPAEHQKLEDDHPGAPNFTTECYVGICLIRWIGGDKASVAAQIQAFAADFGWLAPATVDHIVAVAPASY